MFRKFLLIFMFFPNNFDIYLARTSSLKNIVCVPNHEICQQFVFTTTSEEDFIKTVTINCYFAEPTNTIGIKFTLYSQNSGKYNKLVENTVDFCRTLNKSLDNPFAVKFRNQLAKYGVSINSCPLQGNITLENILVGQLAVFPFFIPHGEYRLNAFVKDTKKNEAILLIKSDAIF